MSTSRDCVRACTLALAIVAVVVAGTAGVAVLQADASQSEIRVWVRDGTSCRFVRASEAQGALPCQS